MCTYPTTRMTAEEKNMRQACRQAEVIAYLLQ